MCLFTETRMKAKVFEEKSESFVTKNKIFRFLQSFVIVFVNMCES